ncbi:MAG: RHS repeat protein, partial [Nitrospinae bacterium]|nr:RHS repeat protein [Nitrospinota bacterium]
MMTSQTLFDGPMVSRTLDANGNVTSVAPPSRPAHGFAYTPVNLESSYNPPVVAGSGTTSTTYAYNLDKQLTRITRPDGQTIDYGYDTAGR